MFLVTEMSGMGQCEDILMFQRTLKKLRDIDDKIIYALNLSTPTKSFQVRSLDTKYFSDSKHIFLLFRTGERTPSPGARSCSGTWPPPTSRGRPSSGSVSTHTRRTSRLRPGTETRQGLPEIWWVGSEAKSSFFSPFTVFS